MDDFTDFGTDYGQREPLTRRIRNLLKDYPDGLPVPKELIQNADDAQASECCLLLDLRQHSTDNLINAKVKGFQGPALVFWNNQTFSPADFQNLCEFGGETKLEDRKKVGKFGLGFNSVYNLTDLPQFVSGEHFCVLDPHEKYFNGKRGKMFSLGEMIPDLGQTVADRIQGQLQPFDGLFQFSTENAAMGQKYSGTIFRFPLRTADNASVSDICKNSYTVEEALALIKMTNENANLFLLFVQFVNKFRICIWEEDAPEVTTLSEFDRMYTKGDPRDSQVLFGGSDMFLRVYQICIIDKIQNEKAFWDVYVSAPGIKSSDGTRAVGAIAYPSEDLCLKSHSKLLFCFLPLPMPPDTGLPFLVNATFAVTSSRRYLEFNTMDDKSRGVKSENGEWNRTLIEKAVVPALCAAVSDKTQSHEPEKVFNLFPSLAQAPEPLMKQLISSFYQRLAEKSDLKVFFNKARNTYHALVENNAFIFSEEIPSDVQDALIECAKVMSVNCTWLQIPKKVLATLKELQPNLIRQKTKSIDYFVGLLMPNLHQILTRGNWYVEQVYKVLLYALERSPWSKNIVPVLCSNPWIIPKSLTAFQSYNLVLKKPSELVRPDGRAAGLLYFTDDFFPSETIPFQSKHLKLLCEQSFGMFSDYLPINAIKAIIGNLNNSPLAIPEYTERFVQFVSHLNTQHPSYYSQLNNLKTHLCNLKILADTPRVELKSPGEVYQCEMYNLVSYQFSTCNFYKLGLYENSFCDKVLKLYKVPPMNVLLNNLKAAINKAGISFVEKCKIVAEILAFIQTTHSNSRHLFVNEARSYKLIPSKKEMVFCSLAQVCLDSNCAVLDGYLYSVNPIVLSNQRAGELLKSCGVQKSISNDTYENVVNSLTKITDDQVIEVRSIFEYLKQTGFKKELKFPGSDGVMYEAKYLCLNDYELQERSSASINRQLKFCHRTIPHDVALHFGVQTKRQMILEKNSTPLFKEFKQSESLCNRLCRIMQNYSNDMDVFKELIQNADDAGSSEIHFILDLRNLTRNHVFDKQWERLLDPALLVFNDSYFTSRDIEGIQRLGEGSKRNANSKIGKFGVGFNCVYKLTDYPTFLTQVDGWGNGNLCLLDPCCFIKNEGCMLDATLDLQDSFPDSFSCFFVGDEKMNALEGKTMMRLPLRKTESALSHEIPSIDRLKNDIKTLASNSERFLLFLQNIHSIKVSIIDGSDLQSISVCEKKVIDITSLSNFRNQIKTVSNSFNNVNCQSATTALYEVVVEKNLNGVTKSSKWLFSEQVGSHVAADQSLTNWHRQNESPPRRHGAVALPLEAGHTKGECMFFCYLPIEEASHVAQSESIELPVYVNGQFFLGESRRVIEMNKSECKGRWNAYVLQNIVGPAYAKLIQHFINLMAQKQIPFEMQTYLSLFPKLKPGQSKISDNAITSFVARGLFDQLANIQFVPSLEIDNSLSRFLHANSVHNRVKMESSLKSKEESLKSKEESLKSKEESLKPKEESLKKVILLSMRLTIPLTNIPDAHFQLWRQCNIPIKELEPSVVFLNLKSLVQPPVSIQETPLENKSTLLCLIDWACQFIVSAPDKNSLPIYLSAGGLLYHNTSVNKLYSNDSNLSKIFPQLANQLLDHEVEVKLRELEIPCKMSLDEFLSNLRKFFPESCKGGIIKIAETNDGFPPSKEIEKWVSHIWDFLVKHQKALSQYLSQIDQFSILLCQNRENKLYLVPISEGKLCVFSKLDTVSIGTVKLNLSSFDCFFQMVPALFNLSTKGSRSSLISDLIFNDRNNPSYFITILKLIQENHGFDSFTTTVRGQLKKYFYTSYENGDLKRDADVLGILRSLPIHLTLSGNYDSLCGPQRVYSYPRDIPLDGMDCGDTLADKLVPEESSPKRKELQKSLGVISKTSPQIYVEFIIPLVFLYGDESVIAIHLNYLADKIGKNWHTSDQNAVIASLKDVAFAENIDGEKKRLGNLYDQVNALYVSFLPKDSLLNIKYYQGSILELFKKCGLKHEVTKSEVWHFVGLIASELINGTCKIDEANFEKMKQILHEFEKFTYGQTDYEKLEVLPLFETLNMGIRPLKECFDFTFSSVVSEVAPVLSERFTRMMMIEITNSGTPQYQNTRLRQYWTTRRGNNFAPSTELVFQNLTKLCSSEQTSPHKVFACLEYLCDKMDSLTHATIKELQKLHCVQVKNGEKTAFAPPRLITKVLKCPCEEYRKRSMFYPETEAPKCLMIEYVSTASDQYLPLWSLFERCGATETISLQQVIYALETFKEEYQGEIQGNPNMLINKYKNLEDHFSEFLLNNGREEIAKLDVNQPVYLRTCTDILADVRSCIMIDDRELFKLATDSVENFENFIPAAKTLKLRGSKHFQYGLKKLPISMRPKFFTEMVKVFVDPSTLVEENSSSEEFELNSVLFKLKSERFQDQCIRILNRKTNYFDQYQTWFASRQEMIDRERLNPLNSVNLKPVRNLLIRCEIVDSFSQTERTFTFQETIFADEDKGKGNFVFAFSSGAQSNEEVLKVLIGQIFCNLCHVYTLTPEHTNLIYYILFKTSSQAEENLRLVENGIETLSLEPEEEKKLLLFKLGEIVPFNLHAIIEYDLFRSFRMEEFVALKVSPSDLEDTFKYAQFLGEETPADFTTDPITMAKLRIRTKYKGQAVIIDGSKVYGFKEKPDKQKPAKIEANSNETIDEDLKNIAQIIWNAGQNCSDAESLRKNLGEINTRVIESVMHKYQNADEQHTVRNSLSRMIAQEIDKALQQQTQEADQPETRRVANQQYSQCQEIVQDYVMQHFERMRNEIDAYDRFRSSGGSRSSPGRQQNSSWQNIESLIGNPSASKGPHPGLAQLWLRQAKEDLEALNETATSEVFNSWNFDIALKVIENSLAAMLTMHDSSLTSHFSSKLEKKQNHSDLFEWVSSYCIEHLGSETKESIKEIMEDILELTKSNKTQLHRPDIVEMRTSRCSIPKEKTSKMITNCRKMFTAAKKVVNHR